MQTSPTREDWLEKIQQQRKNADPKGLLTKHTLDNRRISVFETQTQGHMMKYASTPWVRCQRYHVSNPNTLNTQIRTDLQGGMNGVWIDIDSGSGTNLHGDGGSLWNLERWDRVLDGIYLEAIPLHIHGSLKDVFALLTSLHERNVDPLLLGLGLDPCAELATRGSLPCPMKRYYHELHNIYRFTQARGFATRIARIDSQSYHNAGATPRTELAIMLSTAAEYLRNSGLSPQELSDQLILSMPVGRDIAENIAKLRAARMLFTALFSACGIEHTAYIHAQTSIRMLTIYDPWTNMLRNTHASFSAAVAKADSICVLPYDTRLGQTSDLGQRVARNTHNILAEECRLDLPIDPVHGAHLLEAHTNDLMNAAWEDFQQLEAAGGIYKMLLDGRIHRKIEEEYQQRRSWVSKGKIPIVGTTHFPQPEEKPQIVLPNTKKEERSIHQYMISRGEGPTIGGSSIANSIMQLRAGATTFELEEGMFFRGGITAQKMPVLPDALPFEKLRNQPTYTIPIILIGDESQWSARAQFAESFLLSGGLQAQRIHLNEYANIRTKSKLVLLCGSDSSYSEVIAKIRPHTSILLVSSKTDEDVWGLIHNHCDRISLLKCIRTELV